MIGIWRNIDASFRYVLRMRGDSAKDAGGILFVRDHVTRCGAYKTTENTLPLKNYITFRFQIFVRETRNII